VDKLCYDFKVINDNITDMIYSLEGKIIEKGIDYIAIEINGISYQVFVTDFFLEKIETGQTLKLFTYLHVRENLVMLFGFENCQEREYFKKLNDISGIGPKSAINVLSMIKIKDLEQAILEENLAILTKVSGIGRKTAERIILELKGKIGKMTQTTSNDDGVIIDALISMGYTISQARLAVRKISPEITKTEKRIKEALKALSRTPV